MQVEVVAPERVIFSGEATMVVTRTLDGGDIAFLPGHAPFLGALIENHTRVQLADGSVENMAVHGGFVEVSENRVTILSDLAELASEIDVDRARRALEQAETTRAHEGEAEAEGEIRRQAEIRRNQARLLAAGA
jgi:F-type H+-transporting ATPase subunit epsilon